MKKSEKIDQFLPKKWEWSKTEQAERFWLDCTKKFLIIVRKMKRTSPNAENHPFWVSFFNLRDSYRSFQ